MQEQYKITADVAKYQAKVQVDLLQLRAMDDLQENWVDYLGTERISSRGIPNPARSSKISRRNRNKTPMKSEIENMVCLLSLIHQHWEVHKMISYSFQEEEEERSVSQRPTP